MVLDDDMKDGLYFNVKHVYADGVVEVDIISNSEREAARGRRVVLVRGALLFNSMQRLHNISIAFLEISTLE